MQVVLDIIDGPLFGRSISFRGPVTVTLGRTERADYVLDGDPQISSLHLQLQCETDACFARDLNSSNGTWVNGQRVLTTELEDGDLIRIGKTTLKLKMEGRATPQRMADQSSVTSTPGPRDTASGATAETMADRRRAVLPLDSLDPPGGSRVSEMDGPPSPLIGPSPGDAASVVLRIETEIGRGQTIAIRAGQHLTFGRDEQADIVVSHDPHLSSLHFSIKFDGKRCELRDLDSRNGVAVNGIAVRTAELHDGDEILAGETRFRVNSSITPLAPG